MKAMLDNKGVSQRDAARALSISPATVNLIVNKGQWPKTGADDLRQRFAAFLQRLGYSRARALAAVKRQATTTTAASADKEQENTMIRMQALSPKTRRAFNITRDPFADDVDLEDLYLSPSIRFVRESIYQTARHGGLLAVIGQSGSGKSTLRRELKGRIAAEGQRILFIEPYVLGMEDNDKTGKTMKSLHVAEAILYTVAPGQKCQSSPEARFRQAHKLLCDSHDAGNRHCLLFEEAHGASYPLIKHLKRFQELEHKGKKLLSIILFGQTELESKLSESNAEVREFVQRCERVTVDPLDDIWGYVSYRCAKAGLDADKLFERAALDALPAKLQGPASKDGQEGESLLYPLALGNMLKCALNAAAAAGESRVTADIVMAL